MALSFPLEPSLGQTYQTGSSAEYTWSGTHWTVSNGLSGTSGTSGTAGTSGTNGAQGPQGSNGVVGTNGTSGTSGFSIDSGSFATTSSFNTLSSSVDSRLDTLEGKTLISSSSQLTSSFDTRYALSASFVSSSNLSSIQTITSASYAALAPVSGTLYIIIG